MTATLKLFISRFAHGLEEKLGVRLLRRTTRSMTITDAGRDLLRHAQAVVDAAVVAEASVTRLSRPVGVTTKVAVDVLTTTVALVRRPSETSNFG